MTSAPRRLALGAALAAALAATGPGARAVAQPAPGPAARPARSPGLPVGAWATYRWTSSVSQTVPVLVQQPGADGRVTWSVTEETVSPAPILVTYAVVQADAKTYTLQVVTHEGPETTPLSVTQVRVDRASGKVLRSVTRRAKGALPTPEGSLRPLRAADVAQGRSEEITVPAGRFTAVHGTARGAEVWVADAVPVLGLVRGVWRDGTLELLGSATRGAKDLFKP